MNIQINKYNIVSHKKWCIDENVISQNAYSFAQFIYNFFNFLSNVVTEYHFNNVVLDNFRLHVSPTMTYAKMFWYRPYIHTS